MAAPSSTLVGTDLADNLTTVQSSVVEGVAGNDTISLNATNDWAKAGAGDDSVRLIQTAGSLTNVVKGQDGNDTITLHSSLAVAAFASTLKGGKGADLIQVASGATVSIINEGNFKGGSDNDTILLNLSGGSVVSSIAKGGDGNDSIVVQSGGAVYTNTVITGGKGQDTLVFNASDTTNTTRLSGGAGKDSITIGSAATLGSAVGGDGKDSIVVNSGALVGSVIGGGQQDTINLGTTWLGGVIYGDGGSSTSDGADKIGSTAVAAVVTAGTINGGGGNDTIELGAASAINIDGGIGDDSITVINGVTGGIINGGAGSDTIEVDFADGIGGSATVINGGDDADLISIGITTATETLNANQTINGGAGADTILFAQLGSATSVAGGDGNDSISITSSSDIALSGNLTGTIINGGAGSDTISFSGSGYDNYASSAALLSGGVAAIQYGSGDVIHLVSTAAAGDAMNGLVVVGNVTGGFGSGAGKGSFGNKSSMGVTGITAGELGVYSDGTDTFFAFGTGAQSSVAFSVLGADLVTSTAQNTQLAAISNNFGFTLGGSASTGLTITLA